MQYTAEVLVYPKEGVLDTQGKAVAKTLLRMGYPKLGDVRVGKYIQIRLEAESLQIAQEEVSRMCFDLLVNDLIEDYRMDVRESKAP